MGEGHHADERQIGDAARRRHRDGQLVNPEKGLEDEQIGTATRQDRCLLRVRAWDHRAALGLVEVEHTRQRRDRPRHQNVTPRDLPRLARQLDRCGVDLFGEVADPAAIHARP